MEEAEEGTTNGGKSVSVDNQEQVRLASRISEHPEDEDENGEKEIFQTEVKEIREISASSQNRASLKSGRKTAISRCSLGSALLKRSRHASIEDYDTDLESDFEEEVESADPSAARFYEKLCKKKKVLPASFLIKNMGEGMVRMRSHYLGANGTKLFAKALQRNAFIDTLDLSDNYCDDEGCEELANVLKENFFITNLNISMNFMGPRASAAFAEMLESNMSLKTLKLQSNRLKDNDAAMIGEALKNNVSLASLDLSNNEIGDDGAVALSEGLAMNVGLTDLDISWNCLREAGAVAIGHAIKNNKMLEILDVSWNGFGTLGAEAFSRALRVNSRLKVLDMSNTRIDVEGAKMLADGLKVNKALESLIINTNPINGHGIDTLIIAVEKGQRLRLLSVEDINLTQSQIDKLEILETTIDGFMAMHSGVGGLQRKRPITSVMILFDRFLQEHRDTLVDLFRALDSDGSGDVTLEELKHGFKEHGLRLTNRLIDMLLEEIDTDKSGTIEFDELMNAVSMAKHTAEKQLILADPMKAVQEIRERKEQEELERILRLEAERAEAERLEAERLAQEQDLSERQSEDGTFSASMTSETFRRSARSSVQG